MRAAQSTGNLSYPEADFEVFRPPPGTTRCTDGVKFGTKEGTNVLLLLPGRQIPTENDEELRGVFRDGSV